MLYFDEWDWYFSLLLICKDRNSSPGVMFDEWVGHPIQEVITPSINSVHFGDGTGKQDGHQEKLPQKEKQEKLHVDDQAKVAESEHEMQGVLEEWKETFEKDGLTEDEPGEDGGNVGQTAER